MSYFRSCFFATTCSSVVAFFWFDELYPIGIISNLLIAPFGALISCQLGLPILFLNYFLDQKLELLVELVVWLTHNYEQVVMWVSTYSESSPMLTYVYIVIILFLSLHRMAVTILNQKVLMREGSL